LSDARKQKENWVNVCQDLLGRDIHKISKVKNNGLMGMTLTHNGKSSASLLPKKTEQVLFQCERSAACYLAMVELCIWSSSQRDKLWVNIHSFIQYLSFGKHE
jgi:hypothetical protein